MYAYIYVCVCVGVCVCVAIGGKNRETILSSLQGDPLMSGQPQNRLVKMNL